MTTSRGSGHPRHGLAKFPLLNPVLLVANKLNKINPDVQDGVLCYCVRVLVFDIVIVFESGQVSHMVRVLSQGAFFLKCKWGKTGFSTWIIISKYIAYLRRA